MNPRIIDMREDRGTLTFTLENTDVSLANAIRRIVLSDIPIIVFKTFPYQENKTTIEVNTTRFNNEIIKQRLGCIPIHIKDIDIPLDQYKVVIHKKNDTDSVQYITTEDFQIINIQAEKRLKETEIRRIFPPNPKTDSYIDFLRLRPKLADNIDGEELKLQASMSISTAKEDGMYNCVSTCSYANTPDPIKMDGIWSKKTKELKSSGLSKDAIEAQKKNWYLLEGKRYFTKNSFDFIIESIGVYTNQEIVQKAIEILSNKLKHVDDQITEGNMPINLSNSTIKNCFDVTLVNEDYTLGMILEYMMYSKHFEGDKILSYIGFKKFHPHDKDSTLRIAFKEKTDMAIIHQYIQQIVHEISGLLKIIQDNFKAD